MDSPPDPTRAPTPPSMPRKPKPWEQSATSRTADLQACILLCCRRDKHSSSARSMYFTAAPNYQNCSQIESKLMQGALRAAAESGFGPSPNSDGSPFQGSSNADRENGMHLRQQVSEAVSVGQDTPAVRHLPCCPSLISSPMVFQHRILAGTKTACCDRALCCSTLFHIC